MLALAVLAAAPAQASASWASIFASPSVCGAGVGPFAAPGTDATAPPAGWQQGPLNIPLAGTGTGWEWKVDCGPVQSAAGGNAAVNVNGVHNFTVRATDGALWTDWEDHTVMVDGSAPVNDTGTSSAWRRGPVTVPLDVSDDVSPVHGEWRLNPADPWTIGANALVTGTGVHTLYTAAVDAAGNRTEKTHTIRIDDTEPVDNTTVPVGWQHNSASVTITGSDAGQSGVASVRYQIDSEPVVSAPNGQAITISAHGTHTLRTKIVDGVGNESDWKTQIVQVDAAGPVDTTTVPAGWITTPSTVINVSGTDTGGSGVVRIEWELDDTTSGDVAGAGPVPVTVAGDGVHKLETRITDAMGDDSGWRTQYIRIDTVVPTDTTTAASGWLPQTSLNVTVGGTDAHSGVNRVEWRLDGVAGSANTDSQVVTVSGNGTHTLETRVVDNAGLASSWFSRTIRLDSTAPVNVTDPAPTGWRTSAWSVVVGGTDSPSGVAAVAWRVNGGAWTSGTNNEVTAVVNGSGTHTLETRITDVAGNNVVRTETVRIDSVKPTDTTAYPVAPVPNGRKIPLTGTDAHSGLSGAVEWQLDSGPIQTSASATLVGGGSHTLRTRVQDNAGNWSDWRSGTVIVDGSVHEDSDAPLDTTSIPTNWRTGAYTVTLAADDQGGTGVDYMEYRVDGGPIQNGAPGTTFTIGTDGAHSIETRATDRAGNTSTWRTQTLRIDTTQPQDTSDLPTGWTNSRTFTLKATDATSGVDRIDYTINPGAITGSVASGGTVTLPADGTFTITRRVHDVATQVTVTTTTVNVDTVLPANTSAAAPTTWQTSTISLALAGTDALSGVDHAEWRVDGGDIQVGSPATVAAGGIQTLETRIVDRAGNASAWRSETVRVDRTKPVNTTPTPGSTWRKTDYTTTVTGTDASPGSGVLRVEWRVNGGPVSTTPSVTINNAGSHKLESRVIDVAGNASDWRADTIGIDKTAPTLSVDCGSNAWRATPATCSVSANGGESGLPTLTARRGSGSADQISDSYTVEADGAATLHFRAVDGAGNETKVAKDVKVDRTPPSAAVSCTPGSGLTYVCRASGSDGLSGLAGLSWSVDGSGATGIGNEASFVVHKGTVVVTARDNAGNTAASAPVALADRTPPPAPPAPPAKPPVTAPPAEPAGETPTPRTASEAVLLRGGRSSSSRLLGQLALSATPTATTVDLRPLALGKGRFRFVITVKAGKKTKTYRKTVKTRKGYSPRISVKAAAASETAVRLSVQRRSGRRWSTYATGSATLH